MKNHSDFPFALPEGRLAKRIRQRKRPVQARSRTTVNAILEGTLQVLLDGGITAINTTRVAERAGVSVGTLYQYFPDKESLLMALQVHYAEQVTGQMINAVRAAISERLHVGMRAIVMAIIDVKQKKRPFILAMRDTSAWPSMQHVMRESRRDMVSAMEAFVRQAAPHVPEPALKTRIMAAALEGALGVAVNESPALLDDAGFAEEIYALAMGYLTRRASARGRARKPARSST